MTGNADGIQRPVNVKNQVEAPPERRVIQQKGRGGTINRTRKEIWIRKKQNEIGRGHTGIGVPLCDWLQSSSIDEKIRG